LAYLYNSVFDYLFFRATLWFSWRGKLTKVTAHDLAKKQKEISVAEFFERNKHILGFGNPTRALITSVKEGVDNSLDACEEVNILPEIYVEVRAPDGDECEIIIEDNGPGIVGRQIPHIFGRLLYGSRFHAIRQSRGQQGIGISAVILYGQLTTGRHAKITSKIEEDRPAVVVELAIDTNRNRAETISRNLTHWEKPSGTRVEVSLKADYIRGKRFVYEYLQSTSIVNPHARIVYKEADGTEHVFERTADVLPRKSVEIKPHPYGVELGTVIKMAKVTKSRMLSTFLKTEFSSMGERTTKAVIEEAHLEKNLNPKTMSREQFLSLHRAFKKVKIMAPPTDCLSPIGQTLIKRSLKHETQEISPEFIITSSRPSSVYSGNPFQVEAGLVYGGNLPKDKSVRILRFANRVPLLYQQGGCVTTAAISSIDWRRYGLDQPSGKGIPVGPAIFFIHVSSTLIPFTSESKEAIADIPEIENEIKLALRECARKVQHHIHKKVRRKKTREKFDLITKILPEIAKKSADMLNKPIPSLDRVITKIMDVVWIEDTITYEKVARNIQSGPVQATLLESVSGEPPGGVITMSKITVANYKRNPQKFNLYVVIPEDAVVGTTQPEPSTINRQFIKWELESIPPAQKIDITFELAGLEKGDFDENDLYVENINPAYVIGADKWEGD
jgi:DNA topoisomerase-6 subunit B